MFVAALREGSPSCHLVPAFPEAGETGSPKDSIQWLSKHPSDKRPFDLLAGQSELQFPEFHSAHLFALGALNQCLLRA